MTVPRPSRGRAEHRLGRMESKKSVILIDDHGRWSRIDQVGTCAHRWPNNFTPCRSVNFPRSVPHRQNRRVEQRHRPVINPRRHSSSPGVAAAGAVPPRRSMVRGEASKTPNDHDSADFSSAGPCPSARKTRPCGPPYRRTHRSRLRRPAVPDDGSSRNESPPACSLEPAASRPWTRIIHALMGIATRRVEGALGMNRTAAEPSNQAGRVARRTRNDSQCRKLVPRSQQLGRCPGARRDGRRGRRTGRLKGRGKPRCCVQVGSGAQTDVRTLSLVKDLITVRPLSNDDQARAAPLADLGARPGRSHAPSCSATAGGGGSSFEVRKPASIRTRQWNAGLCRHASVCGRSAGEDRTVTPILTTSAEVAPPWKPDARPDGLPFRGCTFSRLAPSQLPARRKPLALLGTKVDFFWQVAAFTESTYHQPASKMAMRLDGAHCACNGRP